MKTSSDLAISLFTRIAAVLDADTDTARAVTKALALAGKFHHAPMSAVSIISPDHETLSTAYYWRAGGRVTLPPSLAEPRIVDYGWVRQQLTKGQAIHLDCRRLPATAVAERTLCDRYQINSIQSAPIIHRSVHRGYISIIDATTSWNKSEVERLSLIAHLIGVRLERAAQEAAEAVLPQSLDSISRVVTTGQIARRMAHDLSNPLSAVIWLAQVMEQSEGPASAREDAGVIAREAEKARDILRRFHAATHSIHPFQEPFNINDLIRQALETRNINLEASRIVVKTRLDTNLPPVTGNPELMLQAFLNLIDYADNLLKATAEPRQMRITSRGTASTIRIRFSSNRTDMPDQNQAGIFDAFQQAAGIDAVSVLGLIICRNVVTDHGGQISVKRTTGNGIAILLEIPVLDSPNP